MIRVLIADDHPVVRAGLRAVLESEPDLRVIADVAEADEAVALAGEADVILLDLRFGADDAAGESAGAGATRRIRAVPDAPPVLILTNYDTDADILGAVEAGASGYLLKDAPPEELVAGIRAAAAGESALAPAVGRRLTDRMRAPRVALSGRELQVLGLVAAGRTNREIAEQLVLTPATVKSHLVRIFTRLDVRSRTEAVARARELGLLAR